MPLIEQEIFIGYADRIAGQFKILKNAVAAMSVGTKFFDMLTVTDDADVEIPMLSYAQNHDKYTENESSAVAMVKQVTSFTGLISAMESHCKTQTEDTDVVGWDSYCTEKGVRVSDYTNQVHYARYGRYMLARNVFSEDEIVFGGCLIDPSGAMQFVDYDDCGACLSTTKADGANFAGTQLAAKLLTEIVSGIQVEIVGINEVGLSRTVITPSGLIVGPSGTVIDIPPASGRFTDVTAANLLSGGSPGDAFMLVNVVERDTTL